MKSRLFALSVLLMLLISPLGGIVYAQEDTGDPTNSTESTEPEDGDGNIDPVIYELIQQQAQERFQEMYQLMFGGVAPETETAPTEPEVPTDPTNTTDPTDSVDPTNSTEPVVPTNSTDPLVEGEDLLEYAGPVIPEDVDPALANQFMHAWSAMQSAEEKENSRAAANQYLRAMKQLRNAFKKYQTDNPEVVEDLTEGAEGDGIPEGEAPVEPTEGELEEVQQELVGRFQERFQERVDQMLQNYNDVEDTMSPSDAAKALSALTKAEEKLLRIQERINTGDVEGAVDDLDNATATMDEDFESMDDTASAQMFKTMNKLEARISKMSEQAAKKAAKGEDTSDLDTALADARGNKDKTKDDFKEDKDQGNSGNSSNSSNSGNSGNSDKETGKPDKDTGKPDKDTGKPDKDKGKPDKD